MQSFLTVLLAFMMFFNILAQEGPQPGDIYREYAVNLRTGNNWRVTDPDATNPGAAAFLPNPTMSIHIGDLDKAVRAEVLIDIWGGHVGTTGKKFRFNDHDWIDIPFPPDLNSMQNCYLSQYNIILDLPLEYLKEGINTFSGTSGKQVCYDFGWGQWGWYVMIVRIYYSPDKLHTKASIVSPVPGDIFNDNPVITIEPEDTASVSLVQLLGNYKGYDENGDGLYKDWHRAYHSPVISGHIGSKHSYPFQFQWDTRYVPDQEENSISFLARIRDTSGIWYVSEEVDSLSLIRPDSLSVRMYKAIEMPINFVVRSGNTKNCFININNLEHVMEARLFHRTWNAGDDEAAGGTIEKPLSINGNTYKCFGSNHFFALSSVWLAVDGLKEGLNKIQYSSNTVHHGIEVLMPGPAIILRCIKGGKKVSDPTFSPEDNFVFNEPFYPSIETETEGSFIYYTTDGTDPNPSDQRFRGSLKVDSDITIHARAFKLDLLESNVVTASYKKENTSIISLAGERDLLYPNPASALLNVFVPGELAGTKAQLFDMVGKHVFSETISGSQLSIDISDIQPGIYILKIQNISKRIVIK